MAEIISFDQWKQSKKKASSQKTDEPMTGFLVWLHCPKCNIYEYTELRMPGGRLHKCGTMVEEAEVKIDLRTELTVTMRNLKTLETLLEKNQVEVTLLQRLFASEKEFVSRLKLIAKRTIPLYSSEWKLDDEHAHIENVNGYEFIITSVRQSELWFPDHKKPSV